MGKATFELSILLSLKDVASGRLDSFRDKLRATGKDGRAALKDYEELRQALQRKLVVGGVTTGIGIAGLAGLKRGVDAAGDFEASILDLKSAYQEAAGAGALSASEQAAQLNSLSLLSTRLGNNLAGSTADYVAILTALKRAGVDATTVLGGAGEAAANLANVSGAVTHGTHAEQAKELGQFGIMFDLKPRDFARQVDLFSALKDRFDIESSELIESAKYFQSTAKSLRLTGFEGATETSKFFALLKRRGALEGSQAGTSGTSFFQQFIAKGDQRAKIKKTTGLDIKLFDKKGEFAGFENAFREMEKFRKFSAEKRLGLLNEIFGEQGGKVAGVMVEAGAEGWRNVSTEAAKAVPVQEKIIAQMGLYNSKVEALQGTISNLTATAFTPLLDTTKPLLDTTNELLGSLQSFAQANPGVASVTTHLLGVGSAGLVVYGSIRSMTTAWRLWRMASEVSKAGSLANYLKTVAAGAGDAGAGMAGASKQAAGLAGRLTALRAVGHIGVTVAVVYTVTNMAELMSAKSEAEEAERGAARAGQMNLGALGRMQKSGAVPAEEQRGIHSMQARSAFHLTTRTEKYKDYFGVERERNFFGDAMNGSFFTKLLSTPVARALPSSLPLGVVNPNFSPVAPLNPYLNQGGGWGVNAAASAIRRQSPELAQPGIMAEFIKLTRQQLKPEEAGRLNQSLEVAFPESFKAATAQLSDNFMTLNASAGPLTQNFINLSDPSAQLSQQFQLLNIAAGPLGDSLGQVQSQSNTLPTSLGRASAAASSFAARVNTLSLNSIHFPGPPSAGPQPPAAPGPQPPASPPALELGDLKSTVRVPSRALGGDVVQSGFVNVHRGEEIVPARVTSGLRRDSIHSMLLTLGGGARNREVAPARTAQLMALRGEGRTDGGAALTRSASAYESAVARPAPSAAAGVGNFKLEVNVNVPAGARAASDPEALARLVEERVGRKLAEMRAMLTDPRFVERMISHEVSIQRERA